jgi:hypothetical protein
MVTPSLLAAGPVFPFPPLPLPYGNARSDWSLFLSFWV